MGVVSVHHHHPVSWSCTLRESPRHTVRCDNGGFKSHHDGRKTRKGQPTSPNVAVCAKMRILGSLGTLLLLSLRVYAAGLTVLDVTTIGEDPQTTNHLNGEAFQQDALVTFNGEPRTSCGGSRKCSLAGPGFQYAAYYISDALNTSVRHPALARRALNGTNKAWESFSFTDYNQTEDDGHDMCVSPSP